MDRLVSVITVVYNGAAYLKATLQSVIGQTYPMIEYIIIDGASSDGTQDIIRKYQHHLAYWISEPDKGIYDAMNKGLRASHGQYVIFLNCGDLFFAADTVQKIMAMPASDVYYGETLLIDLEGKELGTRTQLTTRKLPDSLSYKSFLKGMVVSHQAMVVRRNIAPLYNLRYSCSADIDWCIDVLKRSTDIRKYPDILVKYRVTGYSVTHRRTCLAERLRIFIAHYGLWRALTGHINILFRYLLHRISYKTY
jgi:glycosyltransferase involved in cell wall biosynthesis